MFFQCFCMSRRVIYIFLLSPLLLLSVVCCWKDGYGELLSLSCLSKKERVQVNYDVV